MSSAAPAPLAAPAAPPSVQRQEAEAPQQDEEVDEVPEGGTGLSRFAVQREGGPAPTDDEDEGD